MSRSTQANPLYVASYAQSGGGGALSATSKPSKQPLSKEASASTISSDATASSQKTTSVTSAASTDEPAPEPSQLLAPWRRHLIQQYQASEDAERSRRQQVRPGADWFDRTHGQRSVPVALPRRSSYLQHYESYTHNWFAVQHALRSLIFQHPTFTFSPKRAERNNKIVPPTPLRVLDLGCDPYGSWMLEMAQHPGWEQTQFVGLDMAPCLLAIERLPSNIKQRISFVQADFLERLPFPDSSFDFVRFAHGGTGVPEVKWQEVIDETRRVAGKGLVEIIDGSLSKELAPNALIAKPLDQAEDLLEAAVLREQSHLAIVLQSFFDKQALSLFPCSQIPFAIVLSSKLMDKTGPIPLPLSPKTPPDEEDGTSLKDSDASQMSSVASDTSSWAHGLDDTAGKTALAAHTAYHVGHAQVMYEAWKESRPQATITRRDHMNIFESFRAERTRQASLGSLLGSKWQWHCEMDLQTERALQKNVDILREELEKAKRQKKGSSDGNPALSTQEIERQIRETEAELRSCRVRLHKETPFSKLSFGDPFSYEMACCISAPM